MHDCYATYFKEIYCFVHALCNAHLLRECLGIETYDKQPWAIQMKEFLQDASWEVVKKARTAEIPLEEELLQAMEVRYDDILIEGHTNGLLEKILHAYVRWEKRKKAKLQTWDSDFCFTKKPFFVLLEMPTFPLITIKPSVIFAWQKLKLSIRLLSNAY